jgi:hypothetical protein
MIKCWHYRRIISRSLDENTPLPPAAQAHIANCQDCRRLCEVEHEIVRRLSASAAAQKRSQPPPFLQARIMAQIASSPPAATRASKPFSRYWPAALAIACFDNYSPPARVQAVSRPNRPSPVAEAGGEQFRAELVRPGIADRIGDEP